MELGCRDVVIEGDCLNIIRTLQNNVEDLSAVSEFLRDIRLRFPSFNYVSFSYIPRLGNHVAHSLSRHVLVNCESLMVCPLCLRTSSDLICMLPFHGYD